MYNGLTQAKTNPSHSIGKSMLEQEIKNYIQCQDKKEMAEKAFNLLIAFGFYPVSNNKNIHIQVRAFDYSLDFWPTTGTLQTSEKGIVSKHIGKENAVKVLQTYAKKYLGK